MSGREACRECGAAGSSSGQRGSLSVQEGEANKHDRRGCSSGTRASTQFGGLGKPRTGEGFAGSGRRRRRRRTSSWLAPAPARAQSGTDRRFLRRGEGAGRLRALEARTRSDHRRRGSPPAPRPLAAAHSPSAYTRTGRSVGGGRWGMVLLPGPADSAACAGGCAAALPDCRGALPPFCFTCATIGPNRTLHARWRPKSSCRPAGGRRSCARLRPGVSSCTLAAAAAGSAPASGPHAAPACGVHGACLHDLSLCNHRC